MQRYLGWLAVLSIGGWFGWWLHVPTTPEASGQATPPENAPPPSKDAPSSAARTSAEAGIKASTAEYVQAFNAGNAKAAAALWTVQGEYTGADSETIQGRDHIEKSLAEYFKAHPKVTVEVRVETVKSLGRGLASAEGVVLVRTPQAKVARESRYSALHVWEDGKWYAASVREWVPDPATEVSLKQLEWLIGDWTAKGDNGELKITFAWDEDKNFLIGKYRLSHEGKITSKGTQVIGVNPTGGLRSWMFDSSGTTSDGIWTRDDERWICESVGVLPNGTQVVAVNVLIPLGADSFTWQTIEREIDGAPSDGLPPILVHRVKP